MSGFESVWVAFASSAVSFRGGIFSGVFGSLCKGWRIAGFMGGG